ncbi:LLM class flavin-dependent oxidoreductase [Actinomycetospora termitidis]|uniref:LLM class flavin-dependent oxidoreductase n=1 Tax=Actinomycetospora termitidis TaxID=3053470 RepID=A0ABT7MG45_9PSEU|nr:LLM class flavin-dependent oxidoreductase [Actinomycetospora sp. Odt1-22]MDL5159653.1 LLM class flavin-dependent oxidoreductase [Actinomycetospora sp. Odt1-22]
MADRGTAKEIRFNALEQGNPSFQSFGLWAHPRDRAVDYTKLSYWTEYAQLLERGLFDNLFLADVYGFPDVFRGNADGALRNGSQAPSLDPSVLLAGMAGATSNLCFTMTGSATYERPYSFARRLSTLDHMADGRIGWNIVTSYLESGARAMGLDGLIPHDRRYDMADEFLEGVYRLWEQSWGEGALVKDKETRVYADPSKIERIDLEGEFHRFHAIHATEPSPQRTPLLFQAGGSSRGRLFAATHAEGIYLNGTTIEIVRDKIATMTKELEAVGRSRDSVKFFAGVSVFVDETDELARATYDDYLRWSSLEGLLSTMSGIMGIDLSQYPLDEPIVYAENDANRSAMEMFTRNNAWTLRQVLEEKALCGTNMALVGSPTHVADELIRWMDETDLDGFNIARIVAHETYEKFIDLVVPILQERGRYKTEYAPGTFREKLFGISRIPETHTAGTYRR